MRIIKDNHVIANNVKLASNFVQRCLGLMFSKNMGDFDGILITPCKSIHTFFMFYPIDVVFLDQDNKIVQILNNVKPWRVTKFYFNAISVLEMKAGSLPNNLALGDKLEVICTN